jgi:hypothetical protein
VTETDPIWTAFEQEAEQVIASCEQNMQGLLPAAMVQPRHELWLRTVTREAAEKLGVEPEAIEERVAPYRKRLAAACGLESGEA